MNKLVHSLGLMVALAATSLLAGCELYFGSHDHNGTASTWNYCGSDGYYQCSGDSCSWAQRHAAPIPAPRLGGYECTSSTDCAAGCYCAERQVRGGWLLRHRRATAVTGYHCNTDRSSCEPNAAGLHRRTDATCPTGQICDVTTGTCTATCSCDSDASAVSQGFGYCDEARQTCMTGTDPDGTCAGAAGATCTTSSRPARRARSRCIGADGCCTGQCEDYGAVRGAAGLRAHQRRRRLRCRAPDCDREHRRPRLPPLGRHRPAPGERPELHLRAVHVRDCYTNSSQLI